MRSVTSKYEMPVQLSPALSFEEDILVTFPSCCSHQLCPAPVCHCSGSPWLARAATCLLAACLPACLPCRAAALPCCTVLLLPLTRCAAPPSPDSARSSSAPETQAAGAERARRCSSWPLAEKDQSQLTRQINEAVLGAAPAELRRWSSSVRPRPRPASAATSSGLPACLPACPPAACTT